MPPDRREGFVMVSLPIRARRAIIGPLAEAYRPVVVQRGGAARGTRRGPRGGPRASREGAVAAVARGRREPEPGARARVHPRARGDVRRSGRARRLLDAPRARP